MDIVPPMAGGRSVAKLPKPYFDAAARVSGGASR